MSDELNPKAVEGRKKRQRSFTPVGVLHEIDQGMAEGARKYGPYNWRKTPIHVSDYYNGASRHLEAWWSGEDIDPDSGIHHISKLITNLVVLRDAMLHGTATDDRPNNLTQTAKTHTIHLIDKNGVRITVDSEEVNFSADRKKLRYGGRSFFKVGDFYHEGFQND
jgi:hypothetical protein